MGFLRQYVVKYDRTYLSKATQLVRDPKEQMASQRFEDLRQKMVPVARAAQPTSTVILIAAHHLNGR
ncbi:hypothetical protein KIN20_029531, partial [Parelaphostrongylus tenuis]